MNPLSGPTKNGKCECLEGCPFFNDRMKETPVTTLIKNKYCLTDNTNCARHLIARTIGKPHVPADLYPIDMDRAKSIINKAA